MYRTVLVGLDGSPREASVFQAAVDLAGRHRAALHVCRAATLLPGIGACATSRAALEEALVSAANRAISFRLASTRQPIAGRHVHRGQPATVVVDVAARVDADLIVIGAHGYRVLDGVIGTTASKILQLAPCSVLVVR